MCIFVFAFFGVRVETPVLRVKNDSFFPSAEKHVDVPRYGVRGLLGCKFGGEWSKKYMYVCNMCDSWVVGWKSGIEIGNASPPLKRKGVEVVASGGCLCWRSTCKHLIASSASFLNTGFHLKCRITNCSQVKLAVIVTLHSLQTSRASTLSSNYTRSKRFSTLPGGENKTCPKISRPQ